MKKILSMILVITFVLSTATMAFAVENPLKATKTSSEILVNGEEVQFDAYNINDNNYFKLRDIAKALNGSESQFEVTWDGSKNAINLITNKEYTVVGGELQTKNIDKLDVNNTTSDIYVDGVLVNMKAYNINGNNFFKLRDLGKFTGFNVDWDGAKNRVLIDTEPRIEEPIITGGGEQPYTFSQTKLDYEYNFKMENKGFINFGNDKPFVENGVLYLPIEHIAYLVGREFKWEPSTGSINIGQYYTEETAPKFRISFIYMYYDGKPIYYGYDQHGNPIVNDTLYLDSFEVKLDVDSNEVRFDNDYKPTKWAIDFANSGGQYITYNGIVGELRGGTQINHIMDIEYKVIVKNGKPYLAKESLTNILALPMMPDENNKTYHLGSTEYLLKLAQEVNPSDTLDDGGTYEDTMKDIFDNPVSAW